MISIKEFMTPGPALHKTLQRILQRKEKERYTRKRAWKE
jgi:hypothetical protein